MDQIIQAISKRLGLPETVVRQGLGILLNFLKEKSVGTEFDKFAALLPGAQSLMRSAPSPGNAGSGLGGLLAAADSLLGGKAGDIAKVIGALQGAGIAPDQAAPFANAFLDQAKTAAGQQIVDSLLAAIPNIGELLQTSSHPTQNS